MILSNVLGSAMLTLRTLVSVLVLIAATNTQAQEGSPSLNGLVLENGLNGPSLARVTVSASGANRTETDADGNFELLFPNKQPGETVRLVIQKAGYVVVNDVQLQLRLPREADGDPVIFILCESSVREEWARQFYRLKSIEAIEAEYARKALEATADELAQLRRERDQALAAAERTAEELARLKVGDASELYQEAMRLFLDGGIDEAIEVLDEETLRRDTAAAQEEKEKANQNWLLRARFLVTQLRFDDAERTYKSAIELAPNSFDLMLAFASFSQDLNRFSQALPAYKHALEMARRGGNSAHVAMTLNNLGILHRDQNRMEEARQAYDEALEIRRQLAATNPDTYLPDVATTLNNLGVLHRAQNRMEEARQAYDEALQIRRQLAATNPDTYLPDVAMTLNNLGILHHAQNRMEEARQAYDEALQTYRQLAATNPDTYLPDVATTLNNLGVLHSAQNRMEEARQAYDEALQTYRQLAATNPDTYLPYVAMTLNNLGVLHHAQNRMEEARQTYDEALQTYRQ